MSLPLSPLSTRAGVTRQISPENPTGARGLGARAVPSPSIPHSWRADRLGPGFKVQPFVRLQAGARLTIADPTEPGLVTRFAITSNVPDLHDLVLRIWWDGEPLPSVEADLASFFCLGGRGQSHSVDSIPISVGPVRGCASRWRMPFQTARFELENRGVADAEVVAFTLTYDALPSALVPSERFVARTVQVDGAAAPEMTLVRADGRGYLAGMSLAWRARNPGWWGEGQVKMYLGDDEWPSLVDCGAEDYFGGAWGFGRDTTFLPEGPLGERSYSGLYSGAPYIDLNEGYVRELVLYRWHVADPIRFEDGIRVTIQALGIGADGRYDLRDDTVTATGYLYRVPAGQS